MAAKHTGGKPSLVIRLPKEVIDLLMVRAEEKFGPVQKARAGGASRLVREWIYQGLGLEQPSEWGEKNTRHASYQRARRARLAAEQAARGGQAEDPFANLAGEALAATAQAVEAQAASLADQPDNQDQEGSPF